LVEANRGLYGRELFLVGLGLGHVPSSLLLLGRPLGVLGPADS
jgi:hypothetical protein